MSPDHKIMIIIIIITIIIISEKLTVNILLPMQLTMANSLTMALLHCMD